MAKNKHVGEINANKKGLKMKVISYDEITKQVMVEFLKSGNIVGPKSYRSFKDGTIIDKCKTESKDFADLLGEEIIISAKEEIVNGIKKMVPTLSAKCEKYINDNDISVRLSNGLLINKVTVEQFIDNKIPLPNTFTGENFLKERNYYLRASGIDAERERTYRNIFDLLARYGLCFVNRPCGFGKTYIVRGLCNHYKKVLFLHPTKDAEEAINIKELKRKKGFNIDIKTYASIARLSDEEIMAMDYELIVMDEAQILGAGAGEEDENKAHVYPAIKKLFEYHPNSHFLGLSATPFRCDDFDIIGEFFHNIETYPYTIIDAFDDNYAVIPKYFIVKYDGEQYIRGLTEKSEIKLGKDEIQDLVGMFEADKIDGRYFGKNLKNICEQYLDDTDYMCFLAFYRTIFEIHENMDKVISWFKESFPEHTINVFEITSKSVQQMGELKNLVNRKPKTIDLIFNCQMITTSVHSELFSGIILDRKTFSLSLFEQICGRISNMGSSHRTIIFDIADNCNHKFIQDRNRERREQLNIQSAHNAIISGKHYQRSSLYEFSEVEVDDKKPSSTKNFKKRAEEYLETFDKLENEVQNTQNELVSIPEDTPNSFCPVDFSKIEENAKESLNEIFDANCIPENERYEVSLQDDLLNISEESSLLLSLGDYYNVDYEDDADDFEDDINDFDDKKSPSNIKNKSNSNGKRKRSFHTIKTVLKESGPTPEELGYMSSKYMETFGQSLDGSRFIRILRSETNEVEFKKMVVNKIAQITKERAEKAVKELEEILDEPISAWKEDKLNDEDFGYGLTSVAWSNNISEKALVYYIFRNNKIVI